MNYDFVKKKYKKFEKNLLTVQEIYVNISIVQETCT